MLVLGSPHFERGGSVSPGPIFPWPSPPLTSRAPQAAQNLATLLNVFQSRWVVSPRWVLRREYSTRCSACVVSLTPNERPLIPSLGGVRGGSHHRLWCTWARGAGLRGSCPASATCSPGDAGRVVRPSCAPDGPFGRGGNCNSSLVVWRGLAKDTHVLVESQARNQSQLFMFVT